jgi:hypothetical protein
VQNSVRKLPWNRDVRSRTLAYGILVISKAEFNIERGNAPPVERHCPLPHARWPWRSFEGRFPISANQNGRTEVHQDDEQHGRTDSEKERQPGSPWEA